MGQVLVLEGVGEYAEQKSCECIMDKPIPAGNRGREQQPPRDECKVVVDEEDEEQWGV
jgi:hypothetical protein